MESLLFITTLMRLMDSAGLAEGGPRTGGSCRRLSPLVRPGVQFSPTVYTPVCEEEEEEEEDVVVEEGLEAGKA